jgi:sarcosine oxidase subunit beta
LDSVPSIDGLYIAAGFSGHGFGIAPAIGELMASKILGKKTSISLDAFSFDRFQRQPESYQSFAPTLHG